MKEWKEDLLFDIRYQWDHMVIIPIHVFTDGIKNLWAWRKIIWRDRWWDYSFLMTIIEFKLKLMRDNWDNSHYVNSEHEKEQLEKLLTILNEIQELENSDKFENDKISELYQKFGRGLFDVVEWKEKYDGKEYTKKCSQVERFWD
jgi:hypothetical protein